MADFNVIKLGWKWFFLTYLQHLIKRFNFFFFFFLPGQHLATTFPLCTSWSLRWRMVPHQIPDQYALVIAPRSSQTSAGEVTLWCPPHRFVHSNLCINVSDALMPLLYKWHETSSVCHFSIITIFLFQSSLLPLWFFCFCHSTNNLHLSAQPFVISVLIHNWGHQLS